MLQPFFYVSSRYSTWVITLLRRHQATTHLFGLWFVTESLQRKLCIGLDKGILIMYIRYRNLNKRGIKMGLLEFVNECMNVDSRLKLTNECGVLCAYIGEKSVVVDGYNFPYQAHLITNLMEECGSFK